MLGGLGVAGDVERDALFLEDVGDLVDEVVDDLYVRRFFEKDSPPFSRAEARRIADLAVANPGAPIEPADGDGVPAMRSRLADAVRRELELRKQRTGVMTYDDQLTRLHAALVRRRRRGDRAAAARALARRARRRVPGHRPGAVGHHAACIRGGHAGV